MKDLKLFLFIAILSFLCAVDASDCNKCSTSFCIADFIRLEPQLFRFWDVLSSDNQKALESQLQQIDRGLLDRQRQLIFDSANTNLALFDSFEQFASSGDQENVLLGQQLIMNGEVGCLLLAGGQGTRLQHVGPKGTYPISVIKQKSLFQLCAEKVLAASVWTGRLLRLAILTSSENDLETRAFFEQHANFGLLSSQISFFVQGSLPFLDAQGKLFLKSPFELSTGPDGNGNCLLALAESGILKEWMQEGIKYINVILIDNPLADPFDAELIGFHQQQGSQITLKCTEKLYPQEKVGLLVKQNGRCRVVEYSEMSLSDKNERGPGGKLKHCCANLSLFCFSVEFIQRIVTEKAIIPLHKAWKAATYVDEMGNSALSSQPMAWKFETFIFDWLAHEEKVNALLYPRKVCFAPLKNFTGPDSPETVKAALQQRDREILKELTGMSSPEFPFELSAEFYYPKTAMKAKWRGRLVNTSYVEMGSID